MGTRAEVTLVGERMSTLLFKRQPQLSLMKGLCKVACQEDYYCRLGGLCTPI